MSVSPESLAGFQEGLCPMGKCQYFILQTAEERKASHFLPSSKQDDGEFLLLSTLGVWTPVVFAVK